MSDWQPSASRDALLRRQALVDKLRLFFAERGVLEVETPMLSRAATTDPQLASNRVELPGESTPFYLHTSPEFFMKRLLAAGSGDIWQLGKVFRGAEQGRMHNPEFTLLEWYRQGFDDRRLMDEVAELLAVLLGGRLQQPPEFTSYAELFRQHLGVDALASSDSDIAAALEGRVDLPGGLARNELLDLAASTLIYPALGKERVCFVTGFPADQAALARLNEDGRTARRFEAFVEGVELANGFYELCDAPEQRRRCEAENRARRQQGLAAMPIDEHFLAALESGLPDCAGVAVGFDRVVMLALGKADIAATMSFSFERV
ncbi:MAG: EF-P lysine aminoacylase EpmA [Gammaproteobacteria bacterium]|nr:EF-P lysine aminoacylase EpmA [Gammaproteobacteria bacterium]